MITWDRDNCGLRISLVRRTRAIYDKDPLLRVARPSALAAGIDSSWRPGQGLRQPFITTPQSSRGGSWRSPSGDVAWSLAWSSQTCAEWTSPQPQSSLTTRVSFDDDMDCFNITVALMYRLKNQHKTETLFPVVCNPTQRYEPVAQSLSALVMD